MRSLAFVFFAALVGCTPTGTVDIGGTTGGGAGTNPTGGATGAATGGTSTGGGTPGGALSNLSWELDPDQGAFVWVHWTQGTAGDVTVEYEVDKGEWRQAPTFAGQAGDNSQLIVGIPYEHTASWRVTAGSETVDGDTITTADLPGRLPLGQVTVDDEANQLDTGNFFLTSINEDAVGWSGGTYWAFIIDRDARVVWYQRTPNNHWTLYVQVAQSGDHLLIDEATYWASFGEGHDGQVHMTYLDQYIDSIPTPGLHHAFIQKPDGTLTWGSQAHGSGESLVERDPATGQETVVWQCPGSWFSWGQCESNSMFWDEDRQTYLYSFYTNNTMSELDPTTGQNIWWAGEEPGGYRFIPADSQFIWQHGITWTPQDTLLVSTESGLSPNSTMLREYIVDEAAGTLTEIWNFDSGVDAHTNGDARRLANGNTLHVVGSGSQIIEVDANAEPVWRVQFTYDKLMGRGQFIEDLYTLVSPNPVAP